MSKGNKVFREVLAGVTQRKPSVEERVDHAKMKDQTQKTVDRAKAEGEKNAKALKAMDRREK